MIESGQKTKLCDFPESLPLPKTMPLVHQQQTAKKTGDAPKSFPKIYSHAINMKGVAQDSEWLDSGEGYCFPDYFRDKEHFFLESIDLFKCHT